MAYIVRKIDLSALRDVLGLRRALAQNDGLGFSVIATVLKNKEFPFRNQVGYGPKCSGYRKPVFGKVGTFSASFGILKLSTHAVHAYHVLPTGDAWLSPMVSGPCVPMFQTQAAYESWLAADGTCRQNSTTRQAAAARITQEVEACLA